MGSCRWKLFRNCFAIRHWYSAGLHGRLNTLNNASPTSSPWGSTHASLKFSWQDGEHLTYTHYMHHLIHIGRTRPTVLKKINMYFHTIALCSVSVQIIILAEPWNWLLRCTKGQGIAGCRDANSVIRVCILQPASLPNIFCNDPIRVSLTNNIVS